MRRAATLAMTACLLAGCPRLAAQDDSAAGPFATAIDVARARVVKLYGGGFGHERGFGSGVVVSADGRIVTTLSVLLESPGLRAVLPDGRRFPAAVIRRDEARQLALLQIEAQGLPFFELAGSEHLEPGDWLIAAANPFKVAEGPEPVSVAVGVFGGRTELSARRRAQDYAYEGPVLLTDIIVTTPGSAGGALVDARGRFVGLIGKAVISKRTNTWVNYALPSEQIAAFLRDAVAAGNRPVLVEEAARSATAREVRPTQASAAAAGESPRIAALPDLGIRLFDIGGRARPAYIERVSPDSPARAAGIRPNDLILSVNGESIETCDDFTRRLRGLDAGQPITIVLKRGDELKTLALTVGRGDE